MLKLIPSPGPLRGVLSVPGDKSVSHRAVMLGSLADGDTVISGFLESADCLSTIGCFRSLGTEISTSDAGYLAVHGQGLRGLKPEADPAILYTGNSGTTTRIMAGILSAQSFGSVLTGDRSVNSRPMKRIIDPLTRMGASVTSIDDNNCAPLMIHGAQLHGITYRSPVASAQVKSCILLAGLYADSPVTVIEPVLSRDHTERMLRAFGADITTVRMDDGYHITVNPCSRLSPVPVAVPGDISSAAYFIAAALMVPDSDIVLKNVGINPTRDAFIRALRLMGADIELLPEGPENAPSAGEDPDFLSSSAGEPSADLRIRYSHLTGAEIGGGLIPAMIDELPVLAVAASAAEGKTVIRDAAELRVKESDRISAVTEGLSAMGADIEATDDGFVINGKGGRSSLRGASIRCRSDHRIAMSFAVASLAAEGETVLDDETCVRISYPDFFRDLESLIPGNP